MEAYLKNQLSSSMSNMEKAEQVAVMKCLRQKLFPTEWIVVISCCHELLWWILSLAMFTFLNFTSFSKCEQSQFCECESAQLILCSTVFLHVNVPSCSRSAPLFFINVNVCSSRSFYFLCFIHFLSNGHIMVYINLFIVDIYLYVQYWISWRQQDSL